MSISNNHKADLICEPQLEDVLIKQEPMDFDGQMKDHDEHEEEDAETTFISTVKEEAPDSDPEHMITPIPAGLVKIELEEGQIDPADIEEYQIDHSDNLEEGQIDPSGMIISELFNDKQIYKCQECDFKTMNKIEFMQHVIVGHKAPRPTKRKKETFILPSGFSSRLHMINVLCNVWRSLGQGIWSCFNHHQLCKHSEHCGFCYVRNLSLRTSAGRKKSRNNLEPFEMQTFLDILGGEEVGFKRIISASIISLGNCEPTFSSSCYYLEVSEDICESTNLSDMIDKYSMQELKDKKVIFIFLEKATQVEIGDTFVFESTEFKYGSHIQEINSNEYKCHFLHNNRIVCDDKGAIMPSSTSSNENVKFIVLINASFNSDVSNDFIYGDTAMKYIKKKSFQAMDIQKFEAHKKTLKGRPRYSGENKEDLKEYQKRYRVKHKEDLKEYQKRYREKHKDDLKGYQKRYRGENKEDLKEYQKRYSSGFFKKGMVDKDYDDTSDEVSKERKFEEADDDTSNEVSIKRMFEEADDDTSNEVSTKRKFEEADDDTSNEVSTKRKFEEADDDTSNEVSMKRKFEEAEDDTSNEVSMKIKFEDGTSDEICKQIKVEEAEDDARNDELISEEKIECNVCDFVTCRNDALIRHMATVHNEEKNIKCKKCDFVTSKNNELKRHISDVHTPKTIKCNVCDFVTSQSKKLMKHLETVHSEYKCIKCNFVAFGNDTLSRHIATVHSQEKNINCNDCDFVTSRIDLLLRHNATVHDEQSKINCNECDFVTSGNLALFRHIKAVHNKEKDIKCNKCDFVTTRNDLLLRHNAKEHAQERKIKCNECDFASSTINELKAHVSAVHKYNRLSFVATSLNYAVGKSEKRFQCGECEFATTRKNSLNRHIQRRHTEKNEQTNHGASWMPEDDDHLLSSLVCEPQLGDASIKQEPLDFVQGMNESDEDDNEDDDDNEEDGATPFVSSANEEAAEEHQDDDGIKMHSNDEDFNVMEDGEDEEEKWVQRWKMGLKEGLD